MLQHGHHFFDRYCGREPLTRDAPALCEVVQVNVPEDPRS